MRFENYGLIEPLLAAVAEQGYTEPTPIQKQAIPHVLAGKDMLGCAQTGTGKTAAFALPILQRLHLSTPQAQQPQSAAPQPTTDENGQGTGERPGRRRRRRKSATGGARPIRALILSPTRELAQQIGDSFHDYGKHLPLRHTTIYGGVKQGSQVTALKAGVDILVATPGRLMDLQGQGHVDLRAVEIFVLDEADRMLDMGFINDVRKIIAMVPQRRQALLFSATMPREIQHLADSILRDPLEIRIAPEAPAAQTVDQAIYLVEMANKQSLLEHLLSNQNATRVLVFTRTKHRADRVATALKRGNVSVDVIHANRPQGARKRAMDRFVSGDARVLVASDIAARGIDIDDISHVINFDMPNDAETYIHRIGRTGRAGSEGVAWSFCSMEERLMLDEIERLLGKALEIVEANPFASPLPRSSGRKKQAEKPAGAGIGNSAWRRPTGRGRLGRRR